MKKIKTVFLSLLVILAAVASLPAALNYSPPSPRTGETVSFTLSPSGVPAGAISWNFGDGTPVQSGPSLTVTHVYAAVGSYTASASYFTMSHADVDQATVTVSNPRQVTFSPLQPKAGQAVAFAAQNFFSACIRWDFGDAVITNGAATESHTFANAGSYTVRAYEECGVTYGAVVTIVVAAKDEEPPPVTPTAPALAVSFLSLYFVGNKAEASVAKDFAGLQAFADIQVSGSGILQWQWLVDGMVVKTDTLAVSFGNKLSLDSGTVPGLPTAVPGRHPVTLRFQNPKTDFSIPAIIYFVGLRGQAPVISRVTPVTLAPGKEYALVLEGAELTPDTEISFPAPLALVKKANILSSTRAQAVVFVAPTAAAGTKLVMVKNEYGENSGPGQVTIAASEPALPPKALDVKPYPGPPPPPDSLASLDGFKEMLKKTPSVTGGIDLRRYKYGSDASYGQVNIYLKKGGAPVSGAVVKVDGNAIPEISSTPGWYSAEPQLNLQPGHVFTVTMQIGSSTYTGNGGKIDTIVRLTQPAHGSTIFYKKFPQFDCKWTFSNGPAQIHLYAVYFSQSSHKPIFEQDLVADHVSIPTAPIPDAQGSIYFFLGRQYSDIKFDGLLAFTSGLHVYQNYGTPQGVAGLSDATLEKIPMQKVTGNTPAQAAAAQPAESAIVTELNKTPTLNGHITYEINTDPDQSMAANSTFNFSKPDGPIADAIIKVDGKVIPPNPNNIPPDYGCQGCYKYEGPWPGIAVGHVTTISITAGGTTYTGSGGPIDSFPQLVTPADGATISLQQTPLLNLQWTGAGGIVPVFVNVVFRGGGKHITLYSSQVYTDHVQVHLVKPYDGIPQGATGQITVSLTKECSRMVMDGMMRFTSSPHVFVQKNFYLQLVP